MSGSWLRLGSLGPKRGSLTRDVPIPEDVVADIRARCDVVVGATAD